MPPTDLIRQEVVYSGRVQGVGFRYTTRQVAARHPVVGTVENRSDGTVFLVVEGSAAAVARFLDDVEQTLGRYLAGADARELPATGEFQVFSIRR